MRNKKLRNWLMVVSLALIVAGLIIFSNATDRNYSPGSAWPHIFEAMFWVVLGGAFIGWIVWFGKSSNK